MEKFYESYLGSKSKILNQDQLFSKRGMPDTIMSKNLLSQVPQKRSKKLTDPLKDDLDILDPTFDELDNIFVLPIGEDQNITDNIYNLDDSDKKEMFTAKSIKQAKENLAEREIRKKISIIQDKISQKQMSHLRELILKNYGSIIGNISWNLLILLYQSGKMNSTQYTDDKTGKETKRLLRQMTTTPRRGKSISNEDVNNLDYTSNTSKRSMPGRRSKSIGPKFRGKNNLQKANPCVMKKYFVQLMEIDELLPLIKPK